MVLIKWETQKKTKFSLGTGRTNKRRDGENKMERFATCAGSGDVSLYITSRNRKTQSGRG